jgi:hypothetical protein
LRFRAAASLATSVVFSNSAIAPRYHLNDELLVRTRAGMIPTARAAEIAGPVREALRGIELALGGADFEPLYRGRSVFNEVRGHRCRDKGDALSLQHVVPGELHHKVAGEAIGGTRR